MYNKEIGEYMQKVLKDLEKDGNFIKASRRLHIKEVHLRRKGNYGSLKFIKRARRLL